jgi:hypothetical protein
MVLRTSTTVTVDALTRVMRMYGLGEPHITLSAEAVWADPEADGLADRAALESFAELDMAGIIGPNADLTDSLAVLARPTDECYGWFTHRGVTTAVLAASIGADAALAVRHGDSIRMVPIDATRLVETVVGSLPVVPPGHGHSINVARSRLRAKAGVPAGVAVDRPGDGEAAFAWLSGLPAAGAGELHVAVRNPITGRRVVSPHAVGYHDTAQGRWWVQVVPGHDDDWIVAAPATADLLVTRLREAHRALDREFR